MLPGAVLPGQTRQAHGLWAHGQGQRGGRPGGTVQLHVRVGGPERIQMVGDGQGRQVHHVNAARLRVVNAGEEQVGVVRGEVHGIRKPVDRVVEKRGAVCGEVERVERVALQSEEDHVGPGVGDGHFEHVPDVPVPVGELTVLVKDHRIGGDHHRGCHQGVHVHPVERALVREQHAPPIGEKHQVRPQGRSLRGVEQHRRPAAVVKVPTRRGRPVDKQRRVVPPRPDLLVGRWRDGDGRGHHGSEIHHGASQARPRRPHHVQQPPILGAIRAERRERHVAHGGPGGVLARGGDVAVLRVERANLPGVPIRKVVHPPRPAAVGPWRARALRHRVGARRPHGRTARRLPGACRAVIPVLAVHLAGRGAAHVPLRARGLNAGSHGTEAPPRARFRGR